MKLKILFHDNCFDGAASAALFTSFYRQNIRVDAQFVYQGLQHRAGNAFPADAFDADETACVDFRYSTDARLNWWFDHHLSTFQTPAERAHFEADQSGTKFYDPEARSNTKFLARTLSENFGFDAEPMRELIEWAEVIDGAKFEDARTAVELSAPALKLMTWVENNRSHRLALRFIDDLQNLSLRDISLQDYVRAPLAAILERHEESIAVIDRRAVEDGGIVYYDLIDEEIDSYNKFIAYMLFPNCRYTVGLTGSASKTKILVGSNPWSTLPREHNVAAICERYGGGGHRVVGGISFSPGEPARSRAVAKEIVEELKQIQPDLVQQSGQ